MLGSFLLRTNWSVKSAASRAILLLEMRDDGSWSGRTSLNGRRGRSATTLSQGPTLKAVHHMHSPSSLHKSASHGSITAEERVWNGLTKVGKCLRLAPPSAPYRKASSRASCQSHHRHRRTVWSNRAARTMASRSVHRSSLRYLARREAPSTHRLNSTSSASPPASRPGLPAKGQGLNQPKAIFWG